jgi:hypothetical protein
MVWSVLISSFWRDVEIPVDTEKLLAAATIGRVGVEDLTRPVLVEDAVARKIFQSSCPFGCLLKIVESTACGDLLGLERDVKVIVADEFEWPLRLLPS